VDALQVGAQVSTDLQAKTAIVSWVRFKKRWGYVATEVDVVGGARADVLASDGKMLVEYEVKTNIEDVKRDFANKGEKHIIYGNIHPVVQRDESHWTKGRLVGEVVNRYGDMWTFRVYDSKYEDEIKARSAGRGWDSGMSYFYPASYGGYTTRESAVEKLLERMDKKSGVPNMLVYVVHQDVADKAAEIIPTEYGVVSFRDHRYNSVYTVRKPKKLHANEVGKGTLNTLLMRMSSELANFHIYAAVKKDGHLEVMEMAKSLCDLDVLLDQSQNEAEKA
jgi:hypothetical protein